MKQTLSILLLAALMATSCSKSTNTTEPKTNQPTTLLTKVIDNTPTNDSYGKPVIEFTYNGKQLTKAVMFSYTITPNNQTHLFIYNSSGTLTGTSINQSGVNANGVNKSIITVSDGKITNVKTYKTGDVLFREHSLTYQNGNLTKWFDPNSVEITYQYDSNGNNVTQNAVEYIGGKTDGVVRTTTYKSFDDKNNITNAIPHWAYFRVYLGERYLGFAPGNRNPITFGSGTSDNVSSYTYNSYGYPASITTNRGRTTESYSYEYIEVK